MDRIHDITKFVAGISIEKGGSGNRSPIIAFVVDMGMTAATINDDTIYKIKAEVIYCAANIQLAVSRSRINIKRKRNCLCA